jgi:hypothetical protein
LAVIKITRKKTSAPPLFYPSYDLVLAHSGELVATASMSGRPGVDNYPWDFSMATGWELALRDGTRARRQGGAMESLKTIVDEVEHGARAVNPDRDSIELVARVIGTVDSDSTPGYYEAAARVLVLARRAVEAGLG